MGLTPKAAGRVLRFARVADRLRAGRQVDLARLALDDQGYGHGFAVRDPEGNVWSLGTYRPIEK